ncbi:eukaryotic type KH-domain (KH-domain type I) [Terfezia boudieri ATCC MYA-4762]|uniref:Eukaryotic type KH-domain (KH-domain type I) n=1 Tax=Terfezia boudieri ATCC MYA-4762 TaxID=1051890 RepID=A0A3N4M5W1_9PEZI|nr:eukaryotic type KH-domain (KH-domain type I) [Terfezia boudieri ATCC MYA-4762]
MSSPIITPATTTPTTTTTTTTTTTSNKRAHEDSNNAPDAKRPALDPEAKDIGPTLSASKTVSPGPEAKFEESTPVTASTTPAVETKKEAKAEIKDEQGDTSVPDAPQQQAQQPDYIPVDESKWIHIRAIISSQEAATVIGKGGENVTLIRRMSAAKCTVSDYARGAVERILTVSGSVDAVAKAFGLIIRTLNNEPLEQASTPQSKTYPLRLLVPHILIGSIIGKSGSKIREIQEASGARLNASESCMPLSTERTLIVLGVADAVHIATYYVANTLVEQLTERFGGPAASAYATRSGAPAGAVPGGMQVVPYTPQPVYGSYGHPDTFKRHTNAAQRTPANPYGIPYLHGQPPQAAPQPPIHYDTSANPAYHGAGPHQPGGHGAQPAHGAQPMAGGNMAGLIPGAPLTQQIYIPNDMVGAIIGKGGAKINEIRSLSGSVIKINEPQDNSNERLVTITGTQECNQMALYMLYSRLESEKHRI